MNPMGLEEQRRQMMRMRQKQIIQMQQVRRLQQQQQQQQQQSMSGQQGMAAMGGMYGPPPHAVPNTGVVPPGMLPSYGQLTTMGGGIPPPQTLSQGMPGGPGPMPM